MIERGLIFSFKDLKMECEVIKTFAQHFLDPITAAMIDEAKGNLASIQTQGSTSATTLWSIPEDRPLRTVWSEGDSKPDKKSSHHVRGEFSFVWEIRPLDEKPFPGRTHFVVDGLASTVINVVDKHVPPNCVAQWAIEIGDHQSPGVHFHSQAKKFGSAPFPISLDIPRFPALPMSPFFVLEFALGELFQDRWRKRSTADSMDAQRWRAIHEPRLRRFFKWQLQRLSSVTVGSPWMGLKIGKPAPDLLVAAP